MKKLFFGNEFLKGSAILLILFNLFNVINLLFQIFSARSLSLEDYGVLTVLLSMVYLFAIFSESIQLAVTKQVSSIKSDKEISGIYKFAFKECFTISFWFFVLYLIIFSLMYKLVDIPFILLAINGLGIFFAFITPIYRGILQGKKNFLGLGKNMVVEGIVKLVLAVFFILLGWSLYGILGAVILSMFAPIAYARLIQLKDYMDLKNKENKSFSLIRYEYKVIIIMTIFILFFMIDTFIAKIVFSPELAGTYAVLSVIGKILFIGTQPISKAFFPIANSKDKSKDKNLLRNAFILIISILLVSLLFLYLLPNFIITIFSGKDLGEAVSSLFFVGLANAILAIVNLIIFYRISINNYSRRFIFTSAIAFVVQISLLFTFNSSIHEFSLALLSSTVIFLALSLYKIK